MWCWATGRPARTRACQRTHAQRLWPPLLVPATMHLHVLIHALDVQGQHLLVATPLGVFLELDQALHVVQGLPLTGVLDDFAAEVFEVAAKHPHVVLLPQGTMAWGKDVKVELLDTLERLKPVFDVRIGKVAEGHGFY